MALQVEVVSDVICPWCFLGKRRLDKALAALPDLEIDITWRPFLLDATLPLAGIDRQEYMLRKFGAERLKTIHDPLIKAGQEDGVPFHFDKITRTPNTLNAHRLIRWAKAAGQQTEVVEALFTAYWRDGRNIGDTPNLINIAGECGLDVDNITNDFNSELDQAEVLREIAEAQSMGISGVPTFVINRKFGLSGAQPADTLIEAFQDLASRNA
jgi:predicted DsbA family dithiol-disulfide isomerase